MKTTRPLRRLKPIESKGVHRWGRWRTSPLAGVTMIELIIVLEVILILISLTYPNLIVTRRMANETAAVATLRAIGTSETNYRTHNAVYGDMMALTSSHLLAPDVGAATSAATSRADYYYNIATVGAGASQYFAVALPDSTVGTRIFYGDESGVIWTAVIGTAVPTADSSGIAPSSSWEQMGQ
jgi:Tfp pilus assembly protein PilE